MSAQFVSGAASHTGTVRSRNEDAFLDRGDIGLWAVADGAGGYGAGDVASAAVVAALADLPDGLSAVELLEQVRARMAAVHDDLQRRARDEGEERLIATTAVVLMARDNHFACLWAGDSRAYLLRDNKLSQLTRDHSVVQELVDAGLLTAEAAANHPQSNIITRAIGDNGPLNLDKISAEFAPGDALLLCSDGLFKALTDAEITAKLAAGEGPDQLIEAALQAGARDNVTAVTVRAAPIPETTSAPAAESD